MTNTAINKPRRVLTAAEKAFIAGHSASMTVRELATALGIGYATVFSHLKRNGLPFLKDKIGRQSGKWAGCEKTCPDFCPYTECRMPAIDAAKGYEEDFNLRKYLEYGRNVNSDE